MPKRRKPFLGTAKDVFGKTWLIFERRKTPSGWNVQLGREVDKSYGSRGICPTRKLVDFLKKHPDLKFEAEMLPISKFPLMKLRKRLDINAYNNKQWWEQHKIELMQLTRAHFSEKYGYSIGAVARWRRILRKNMPQAEYARLVEERKQDGEVEIWWQKRKKDLMSLPVKVFAQKYGVSEYVTGEHWRAMRKGMTYREFRLKERRYPKEK
jgi:hypothetical protein